MLEKTDVKGLVRVLFATSTIWGEEGTIAMTVHKTFPLRYFDMIISTEKLHDLELQSMDIPESYSKWLYIFLHELAHFKGATTEHEADKLVGEWIHHS